MLSYNEWEKLNENFDFPLGLVSQPALASVGGLGVDLEGNDLDEGKGKGKKSCKMSKKKMGAGIEGDGDGDELVKPAAPKDKDVDVDVDDEDDDDSSVDDSEGGDEDADDMGDNEGGDDDNDADDMGDNEGGDIMKKKPPFMSKKKSKKKSSKKMKKENVWSDQDDADFLASLKNMMGGNVMPDKNWDGMPIEEEALIAPEPEIDSSPKPGEPGFAPTTRIGTVPTFEEWKKLNFGDEN